MQRRSTRLKDASPQSIADDAAYIEDEEEDVPLALPQRATKPRAKKRKATEEPEASSATVQPPLKKVRGKRGMLKELVEMPMDVLFEIFSQLHPLDLLHLARTTKDLRAILMSRSSVSVWKQAFASISGLPECPDDLAEPQYADLAFGKNCHYCQSTRASTHTCWAAHVRTCTKCLETHFFTQKYVYRAYPDALVSLLPSVTVRSGGRRYKTIKHIHKEADAAWTTEFAALKPEDRDAWAKLKLPEAQARDTHARACNVWAQKQQELRDSQKASVIDERKAIVVDRIKKTWGEELAKMSARSPKLEDLPAVVKACQKDLTERVLESLEAPINNFMEEVKAQRLTQERESFLKERMVTLRNTYTQYLATLPPKAFYPNTAEIFADEIIQDIVNNTTPPGLTNEQLDMLTDRFPVVLEHWKEPIEQQLLELISASADRNQPPSKDYKETVLGLATTFFHCASCRVYLPTRMAIEHKCSRSTSAYGVKGTAEVEAVKKTIGEVPWNYPKYISFFRESNNSKALPRALKMCGFDPATTTAEKLDDLDPIVECLACNDARHGRFMMKWFMLCKHIIAHHLGGKIQMLVLDEDEAGIARKRMEEVRERSMMREYGESCMCAHCRLKENGVFLMKHVKQEHGIARPILDEDVVETPGTREYEHTATFKMWPPRMQEDIDAMQFPLQ